MLSSFEHMDLTSQTQFEGHQPTCHIYLKYQHDTSPTHFHSTPLPLQNSTTNP